MINFDTENLIIVCYPGGAGGKFLINCLGLSDNAVFQDAILAGSQLNGEFDINDKFLYLKNKIQNTKNSWNDLNLGCGELFGIRNEMYCYYSSDIVKNLNFDSVVDELSNGDKKFFIVAHYPSLVDRYRSVWHNAKIVYFVNCDNFIKFRGYSYSKKWKNIMGTDWPRYPPRNIDEYNKLPPFIKSELEEYQWKISNFDPILFHDQSLNSYPESIVWDTEIYFSIDELVEELKKLYKLLDLGEVNEPMIKEYYQSWIDKLLELKGI